MSQTNKAFNWITAIFSVLWTIFIFSDYWFNHPEYAKVISNFSYKPLLGFLLLVGTVLGLTIWGTQKRDSFKFLYTGLSLYIFYFLLLFSIVVFAGVLTNLLKPLSFTGYLIFGGRLLLYSGFMYVLCAVWYVLGIQWVRFLEIIGTKAEKAVVAMALGALLVTLSMMLLGAVGLLKQFVLLPLLLIPLAVFWKDTLAFVKGSLLTSLNTSHSLNWIGYASLFGLLLFLGLDMLAIQSPFPYGYDTLALYSRTASLVNDYNGLVAGGQPYNWSLLMSLGYILTGSGTYMLSISFLGGVLSAYAMYVFGRKWLTYNQAILATAMFFSLPMSNFQLYKDLKIDMGLLFVAFAILILFHNWITDQLADTDKSEKTVTNQLILIGLLSGFALGIKLTALLLIFAILAGIWFFELGLWSFISMAVIGLGILLIAGTDDVSGMRAYHPYVGVIQWIFIVLGIVGLAVSNLKHIDKAMKSVKLSVIYGVFAAIAFLPWPIKNFMETKQLTVKSLLYGKGNGPVLNPSILQKNWNAYKKQQRQERKAVPQQEGQ